MQIKTIEQNIREKLIEWLNTITDKSLAIDVKKHLLLSGGSIASMLLNEPVNDYDIYLTDMDVLKRLTQYYVSNYFITIFDGRDKNILLSKYGGDIEYNNSYLSSLRNLKSNQIKLYFPSADAGVRIVEKMNEETLVKYSPTYFSPNAITLTDDIQIVLRFCGDVTTIHKTFDFVHATNYFTFNRGLVRNLDAIESILTKRLKYQGSHYPLTSIIRAKKFIKRGFDISAGEMLKIMFQISELDLTNPDVLEEQLVGVDVEYFSTLIKMLRTKTDLDKDFKITSSYINEIIDKVFNQIDEK